MNLSDAVAWAAGIATLLSLGACIVLRDLLSGSVPEAQLRAFMPAQIAWSNSMDTTGARIHARKAQRGQWLALAASTVALALYTRPLAWWVEQHTAPGVAWIGTLVGGVLAAMWAVDGLIYSVNPAARDGRSNTARVVWANHAWAAACLLLVLLPWFAQPPQPRGAELDEFVNYYQPTLASFLSIVGVALYMPIASITLFRLCWGASRHERDHVVRTSLRLVAIGAMAAMSIVVSQLAQSLSWTVGRPLWNEEQAALAQLGCCVGTSTLVTIGAAWAPLAYSHRVRMARFLVPLWRQDVIAMRPAWRLLRQVHDGSYEAAADMVTATDTAALQMQRRRMAMALMDTLYAMTDHLSLQGRQKVEELTGGPAHLTPQRWLLRVLAALVCPVLRVVGGFAPGPATRVWRYLTQTPLAAFSPADAACARAAIDLKRMGAPVTDQPAAILTPTPWSDDEAVGYLRLVVKAAIDADVLEASTGAIVRMTAY